MTQETKFPEMRPRKRASSLKRQRLAVILAVCLVAMLVVTMVLVWRLTSRQAVEYADGTRVTDTDGLKYYTVFKQNEWVMQDEKGNLCGKTQDGLFKTHDGATLVMVDAETGKPIVVAAMITEGTEKGYYNDDGSFTILLYPVLERADLQSIEVKNEKDHFTFVRKEENFILQGHEETAYDDVLFSTLLAVTGYTRAMRRLDISKAFLQDADGNYVYEQYEGFRAHGYAEYGLPENPDDAEMYFIITATDGTRHKVVLGNETVDGLGYYARYAGRDEVYILIEGSASDYSSTLSQTLLCAVEDYVTPLVTSPLISESNYFDVENFTLWALNGTTSMDGLKPVIKFSYTPIEKRNNTFYANIPYFGQGRLEGYAINDYQADICLQNILDMVPLRTVKLYDSEDTEANLTDFVDTYGVAFALEFTHHGERLGEDGDYAPVMDKTSYHQIWISPMVRTEDGNDVYYMYNEAFNMIIEVGREFMEYLEWTDFDWVAPNIFSGNIGYLEQMVVEIKNGTTFGVTGVNKVIFDLEYVDQDGNPVENGVPNNTEIRVFATYNGLVKVPLTGSYTDPVTGKTMTQSLNYRYFYQTLLGSTLEGSMPAGSEQKQEELKGSEPDLQIKLVFEVNGETIMRTYRFYNKQAASGRGAYVTVNGNGSFYMLQNRVNKIINDVGRALSTDLKNDAIVPEGKN